MNQINGEMSNFSLYAIASIKGYRIDENFKAFGLFYSTTCWICFAFGVALNSLLIWLVLFKTVGEMKSYSKILLQSCILDLYTLCMAVLVQPVYIMLDGYMIMLQNGQFRPTGQPWNFIMAELWVFGYYFSIISIVIQFLYRYLVLVKASNVTAGKLFLMLLIGASLIWGYMGMLFYAQYPRKTINDDLGSALHRYFDYDPGMKPIQISMIGRPDSYRCLMHCAYIFSIEVICYVTIIWCCIKIRDFVRQATLLKSQNKRILEINKQLTYTLIIQACLPLVAVLIGVFCILVCSSAILAGRFMSFYFISFMTFPVPSIPVMNPLITLIVIKPYRNIILGRKQIWSSTGNSATVQPSTAVPPTSMHD
ncbi:serpentine type 7TM GPCR chemoreceptor srd domain-containing protein [Ditylenchus destructor]|uniref:Serpentine type 7TM GPCR chemoreceptor srd domain-containing protein n=1 Tax=Ditylenchus destructor TaxID=166010 RepID=A0AAD4N892_9BILA|nr:serpentine type 7TM GPCR chemoreceptor srd domain-containing protein [Ditylenchus destructor]